MLLMVGQGSGIIAREARIAILRCVRMARIFAKRAIQAVDGQKREAVGLNKLAHFFNIHAAGEQLGAFGRVDAVKTTVHSGRACNAHMHFGGTSLAHHLHDFQGRCTAHNGIIDKDDAFAGNQISVGIML